jgi:hypothetical protein
MTDTSTDPGDDQASGSEQFDAVDDDEVSLTDLPPEKPWGAEAYGAGGADALDGVIERAARENPEVEAPGDDRSLGGLTDVDDPDGEDLTAESVAELGDEPAQLSAEEAAMHSYSPEEAFEHGLDPDGPEHDGYFEDDRP